MQKRTFVAAVAVTTGLVVAGMSGAVAGDLIGSDQIKNNSIRSVDLKDGHGVGKADLKTGLRNRIEQGGEAGPKGDTGPAGADGTAGPKGDTGPAGLAGAAGPKGDTGPAGLAGAAGAAGPKGDTGPAGLAGAAGTAGPAGADGVTGYYVTNRTVVAAAGETVSHTRTCDKFGPGYVALGGGVTPENAGIVTVNSGPAVVSTPTDRSIAQGWTNTVRNDAASAGSFLSWAVCAQVG